MFSNRIETEMNVVVSSGDFEAVEHSHTSSDHTEAETIVSNRKQIGDYISLHGEKMTFFYISNNEPPIWVQLNNRNVEELVPLWMKELNDNRDVGFLSAVVDRRLHDTNLRPEYCRIEKQVRFFSVHPNMKLPCWSLHDHHLRLPNTIRVFVYQSNGSISYVNHDNLVYSWDWKNDDRKVSWDWKNNIKTEKDLIPESRITALAEQSSGLIVGCEDGHIFLPSGDSICSKNKSVVEIVTIGPLHFAVRYEDNSAELIAEGDIVAFDNVSGIWSVQDRFFFALRQENVLLFIDIHEINIQHEKIFSSNCDIIVVSDTICVSTNDEISIWEGGTSWNTLTKGDFYSIWQTHRGHVCEKDCAGCFNFNHRREINNKIRNAFLSWQDLLSSIREKTFVFITPGTFIFPQIIPHSRLVCISYFSKENEEPPAMFHVDGTWNITSMILLSDGSIMYATDRAPSGIHIITKTGERIFSKIEELTNNKKITSLKEMTDGSVASISYQERIWIIKPQITPSQNSIDEIHDLQSKLINNPTDLDLYDKLGEKFLSTANSDVPDHHSAYQTYLDGLEAVVQVENLRRAKLFYEKAKNIFPDREEPMRLFLSYLMQFRNIKVERTIHLDLFKLLENKKCKQRLFIGEGDFSYTECLINKHIHTHQQLSKAIVATELLDINLMNDEIKKRIELLREKGVRVLTGVDGTKIHEHSYLKDVKFERVHWNCPFNPDDRDSFRQVISNFFRSCEKIQSIGDRIHVALVQGWNDEEWNEFRQYENPIVKASVEAGYRLIKKRPFGKERYPNYKHKSAIGNEIRVPGVYREFVFEKVPKSVYNEDVIKEKIKRSLPIENAQKKYRIKKNNKKLKYDDSSEIKLDDCYFECSTENDSSDYYSD